MNYVKSCLIITMLLGVGYSDCASNDDLGNDCGSGQACSACCDVDGVNQFMYTGQEVV